MRPPRLFDRPDILRAIDRLSAQIEPCVNAADGRGIFLASGGRFYLDWTDIADKPETGTAECGDPAHLLHQVKEGDIFMRRLAALVEQEIGGEMMFTETNVDYASGNTWGCHESYLVARGTDFCAGLVPFLCSRVIYTGSGGWNNQSKGLEFLLSPRVSHLHKVFGHDTQRSKPIVNLRDESHARQDDQRIHLILGEGLHSETSILLKSATTALVVALIELGLDPGSAVALKNPLSAIRDFASDPSCTAVASTEQGPGMRAIDIQRHYLQLAGDHLADLPVWAESVCRLWKEVLDRLESGEEQASPRLDWVIRRNVYTSFLQRRGFSWDTIHSGAALSSEEGQAVRSELFELDTRFGAVSGKTVLFQSLDTQGVLQHRISGWIPREETVTRAKLRGSIIRDAHEQGNRRRIVADWSYLRDQEGRVLDLKDPFTVNAEWQIEPGRRTDRLPFWHA
ncbi:MAG: proteasome accessory factor PafA2 family protein [Acidobacteria bacterium]|nr:proteasome accessory factor PafA2 family protein [Acidobacteriota bacterium]